MRVDHAIAYLLTDEPDGELAWERLAAFRRSAQVHRASSTAAKCLRGLYWLTPKTGGRRLQIAKRMVSEVGDVRRGRRGRRK